LFLAFSCLCILFAADACCVMACVLKSEVSHGIADFARCSAAEIEIRIAIGREASDKPISTATLTHLPAGGVKQKAQTTLIWFGFITPLSASLIIIA
jgi:hypothetical protein